MEALANIESRTVNKQEKLVMLRHEDNKSCKNKIEMTFKELLEDMSKKLMPYAMFLTYKNKADSSDLVHNTIIKLINNKDKFLEHSKPMAYAKKILKNNHVDNLRKQKRMVSIEGNDIPVTNDGFHQQNFEFQQMLTCLESFDETDQIILSMLGAGHSYEEIQEVVSDTSMANLRVKANRARIKLAKCMDRKL
ncbi:RNA polymerase sigma factor [Gammaproteobacteria bacterium]|nr:RNA polymerase sigma factor [Gammaproteobacteria bacterium]